MNSTILALVTSSILVLVGGISLAAILWTRLRGAQRELDTFRTVKDANAYAQQVRADAESEVARLRIETEAQLARARTDSETYAAKITLETQQEASRLRAESEDRLRSTLASVEQHQTMLVEMETRIRQFHFELGELDGRILLQDVGLLAPRYNFGEAFEYQLQLDRLRDEQATAAKYGQAALCDADWTIGGSRAEGKRTTDRILKLMIRAFNGECDALVSKVKYDNARSLEDRIHKSFNAINRLGGGFSCQVTAAYLEMKIRELHLTHEYQDKLQAEKEEQRALREQMRDEERAQREIERSLRDAEQEEERYSLALDRARQESARTSGTKHARLLEQVRDLEQRLKEAEDRRQRAISMAQLTRAGHVYVLSNIGSFGEDVFKIGMTRRLDPNDRVVELGDASVPFPFDVHAMIYTVDAPGLESTLHSKFGQCRVNAINRRKEFFRTELSQIEAEVRRYHGEFKLTRIAEAAEYRKSLAQREASHVNIGMRAEQADAVPVL